MSRHQHLQLIALRTIKYNDRHHILSVYSRQAGRLTFLVSAGSGREASRRRALLMPLSIVECSADLGSKRDILTMRDVSPLIPLHGLHSSPVKASIALFLTEVLSAILRESQEDEALFRFLVHSIRELDALPETHINNFHIAFLCRLTQFLGIAPDTAAWSVGRMLDLTDGVFRASAPLGHSYLTPEESAIAANLFRINYRNMHLFRFSRAERNEITDRILSYYSLHLTPLTHIASLPVLRSL